MARMVNCVKLHKEAEGLDYPPFPGELGVRIWKNVSKEAWADWTRLQTMMVNEYGLNLADASARKHLMTQCERYFFGDGEAVAVPGYKPHPEDLLPSFIEEAMGSTFSKKSSPWHICNCRSSPALKGLNAFGSA